MQLENTFTVPVPVDEAWRVLLDVERVAPCMPGASVDSVDGDDVAGRVKVKVGPIMLTYRGTARFVERDESAHRAVIEASGKETRGSGTAKATVHTSLESQGDATLVRVVTDLAVTGKPAQFGRGVMTEVSAKLIDRFAACLADEVRGAHADNAAAAAAAAVAAQAAEAPVQEAPAGEAALGEAAVPVSEPPQVAPAPVPHARHRRTSEAVDLLETAGMPVAKRVVPLVAGVALLWWLVRRLRRG